jgi:glucose-6-phosphate isomerase/transaldolase/glucose-6-phosphate isomerase
MPDLGRVRAAGHPVIHIFLDDIYDIGGQFYLWEFATAVAGHVLSVNPFDQPDVEATKKYSRAAVQEYLRSGLLETTSPLLDDHGVAVYGDLKAATLRDALISFLAKARGDSYVGFQAYLPCFPAIQEALNPLRLLVRDRYRVATTLGFGPRFLHSTGQLHKGDAGRGLFIQITCDDPEDLGIPDEPGSAASSMSFGVLKAAQAVGDAAALRAAGRPVMKLHIGGPDMAAAIQRITANLK